jgi:hypothetical protein
VLAMPVMVAWVGGLVSAMDRRTAPSFWLLPLMMLWANLHGGFVLGLALVAPFGLDAVWNAEPAQRQSVLLRWAAFGVAAVATSCVTPYGWNAMLASQKILGLGGALPLIQEWAAADFSSLGAFEVYVLLGFGLALYRGVKLPPLRIAMLLGLLHAESGSQCRSAGAAGAADPRRSVGGATRRSRRTRQSVSTARRLQHRGDAAADRKRGE